MNWDQKQDKQTKIYVKSLKASSKIRCDVFYGWTNDPLTDSNLAVRPLDTTAILLSPVKLCWQHHATANTNINCNLILPQEFILGFANKKKTKTDFYLRMRGVFFPVSVSTVAAAKLIPVPLDLLSLLHYLNLNFSHVGKLQASGSVGAINQNLFFFFSLPLFISFPAHPLKCIDPPCVRKCWVIT